MESATFRRVMIAKRYLLWRVRHAHDPSVQVRVIVWFSTNERCHVLLGGDKAGIEELWYVSAAERGERLVDSILRNMKEQGGQG